MRIFLRVNFLLLLTLMAGLRASAQGAALNFDGVNDRVSLTPRLASLNNFTVEAWCYRTTLVSYQTIYSEGTTGSLTPMLSITAQQGALGFEIVLRNTAQVGLVVASTNGTVPLNQWTHVAFVRTSATTAQLYINGALTDAFTFSDPGSQSFNVANIGVRQRSSFDGYFVGSIDEVRLWNTARTCDEIAQRRSCELTGSESGLVAYYKFNQGVASGSNGGQTALIDASPNGFNGTLQNFALNGATSNWVSPGGVVSGNTCTGIVNSPEINVTGNSVSIADGTTGTSTANFTSFSTVTFTRSFTIENTGTSTLTLSNPTFTGANAAEFSVTTAPSLSVAAAGSTTFTVTFAPTATGTRTAVLHIASNDCDESDYDFVLDATAEAGGALDFDGVDDYASTLQLLTPSYTKEAWVKLPTANTALGNYNIVSGQSSGGAHAFWITDDYGSYKLAAGHNGQYGYVLESTTFPRNVWVHVAVTYDAATTTMRLYRDGTVVASNIAVPALSGASNYINIGQFIDGVQNNVFLGQMDEVRVWNRALCAAEIVNNMSGALPSPTTQSGLILYYTFNQGFARANNSGITVLTDASVSGKNGTLTGFAKTGSTSNFVTGTVSGTAPAFVTPTASQNSTSTQTISGTTQYNVYCNAIASITPSGSAAISGSVTTRVRLDGSVQSYLGRAYVQRHYDIEPVTAPNTATATVTLYFTQSEFTAYNAANGADPDLPVDAADATNNKANLRITQFHGTSASGIPGTYTGWAGAGPAIIIITPTSVTWNATASRWEAVIPVTGFSGFFAAGAGLSGGVPLPIEILSFSAQKSKGGNLVKWSVAKEEIGTMYSIERSADGRNFSLLAEVAGGGKSAYSTPDALPLTGNNYYRLKISESNKVSYSGIALVRGEGSRGAITVSPVPATSSVRVLSSDLSMLNQTAVITDMAGREIYRFAMAADQQIDVRAWPAGVYSLKAGSEVIRIVKQ